MASRSDDRILSYGDSTLVQSDLSILRGPHYLNDRLIHFFFSHLASSFSSSSDDEDEDVLLVAPSVAYLIANFPDPASLADVVAPLRLPRRSLVLLPVNDNPDVTLAEGGSHWSLLVCHVPSRQFVHHDSSGRLNSAHALNLFHLLKSFFPGPHFRSHSSFLHSNSNLNSNLNYKLSLYDGLIYTWRLCSYASPSYIYANTLILFLCYYLTFALCSLVENQHMNIVLHENWWFGMIQDFLLKYLGATVGVVLIN